MTILEKAQAAARVLDDKLAKDVKLLNIGGLTTICDYFVIASGSSITQVKALSDYVDQALAKEGAHAKRVEGNTSANWILMDYEDVIIHIFTEESREFYSMERLWSDAANTEF